VCPDHYSSAKRFLRSMTQVTRFASSSSYFISKGWEHQTLEGHVPQSCQNECFHHNMKSFNWYTMNNNTMPPAVNLDAWQDYHINSPSSPSFPTSCISGFSSILFPQKPCMQLDSMTKWWHMRSDWQRTLDAGLRQDTFENHTMVQMARHTLSYY
jgi:hypothetical protein